MGVCVSVHKKQEQETEPAMKLNWLISTNNTGTVLVESPIKENIHTVKGQNPDGDVICRNESITTPSFKELSNKDEIFFDSQPWLDSDCEDYFSVCDDTTPSRGNSPLHPSSCFAVLKSEKSATQGASLSSIPGPPKPKQLIDLFRESFNNDSDKSVQEGPEAKLIHVNSPAKSPLRSPNNLVIHPVSSTGTTPNRTPSAVKVKSAPSAPCCLPNLVRSLSFGERKKRLSSTNGNDK